MLGAGDLVLVGTQQYILRVLSLVVFVVVFVYGSSRDSSCYCLFCSSVASVSILSRRVVVVVVVVRFVSFERW